MISNILKEGIFLEGAMGIRDIAVRVHPVTQINAMASARRKGHRSVINVRHLRTEEAIKEIEALVLQG